MLRTSNAVATIAVRDLETAREFYEGTLGLEPIDREGDEVIVFRSGDSSLNVYRSQYAGTNRATAVSWAVGEDLAGVVRELRAKGVRFEHYDLPGMTRDGDVHLAGDLETAWFRDPDGNILNLVNR
jgi:catechol 2,3-dioxygenase-like lactoylglutathione lyase family enzyme